MQSFFKYTLFLFLFFPLAQAHAQKRVVIDNLQDFDEARFHFGFNLCYNSAGFYMDLKPNYFQYDSLQSLYIKDKPGFNLTVVSSLKITPNWRLRFLPTLSFQERDFEYTFYDGVDTTAFWKKTLESTFLDFPLLFKMRTNRIGNFAAYLIGGGKFGIDMQSNTKVDNGNAPLKDQVLKISRTDYGLEVGAGMDFFLEYFKFGLEVKLSRGLKNILIQENTYFSSPIESLRSKLWTVSLTFEG